MSTADLIRLVHHRWSVPVLAVLAEERGARLVVLTSRLGVGRETLTRTLDSLIELGLVRRNSGYGHPLRPEYLLTEEGSRLAPSCARLLSVLEEHGLADVALRKWSLPVLAALDGDSRFSELCVTLPGVTSRALALALKQLAAAGLVEREIVEAFPPATVYRTTREGHPLRELVHALAAASAQ
jgi:DNA-binding HxlR family transcriptional regulator